MRRSALCTSGFSILRRSPTRKVICVFRASGTCRTHARGPRFSGLPRAASQCFCVVMDKPKETMYTRQTAKSRLPASASASCKIERSGTMTRSASAQRCVPVLAVRKIRCPRPVSLRKATFAGKGGRTVGFAIAPALRSRCTPAGEMNGAPDLQRVSTTPGMLLSVFFDFSGIGSSTHSKRRS